MFKNYTMLEELNAVMTGELECDNINLSVYTNYCKKRIESIKPFVEEVEKKNVQTSSILEIKNKFVDNIQQFEKFLVWCKIERGVVY